MRVEPAPLATRTPPSMTGRSSSATTVRPRRRRPRAAAARAGKGRDGRRRLRRRADTGPDWLDTSVLRARRRAARGARGEGLRDIPSLALGDVNVEAELVDGSVPEALAEVAKLRDAEEVAVGSRRLGWFRGALGSVSRRGLDRLVVVVPRMSVDAEPARAGRAGRASPPPGPIPAHSFRF